MKSPSTAKSERERFRIRLRQSRVAASLTQSQLARALGITPSAVAQWENPSGTAPELSRLADIAKVTGVRFEWLATGNGVRAEELDANQEIPAVALEVFAQDDMEEDLLTVFRKLSEANKRLLLGVTKQFAKGDNRRL